MSKNKRRWWCREDLSKVSVIVLHWLIIIPSNQMELKYFSELSR